MLCRHSLCATLISYRARVQTQSDIHSAVGMRHTVSNADSGMSQAASCSQRTDGQKGKTMKRNTYRKNNKAGAGREAAVDYTAVENHAVEDHTADVNHTVDGRHNRHNRQGAAAADDTEGVSAAEASMSSTPPVIVRPAEQRLTFTLKNMTDLVIAYEAYQKLEQSIMLLTGVVPDNPILEGLQHIDEIIMDISPVFDDVEDYDEYDTFVGILEDPMMSAEQKAEILMCGPGSSSCCSDPSSTVDDHRVDNGGSVSVDNHTVDNNARRASHTVDNEENNDTSIPFTLEHMELLLTAYDGYRELQDGLMDLLKMDPEEGVFHSISQLDNLICKLSPIYDRTKNYQDQELGKVLLDDSSPLHVRAEKLMGLMGV